MKNGGNPDVSPILSVTNAPAALLRKLPQIRMTACEVDSLRDQVFYLGKKIKQANSAADVKIYYLREYLHGYCGMAKGVHLYEEGNTLTIEAMR